jgi:glycosyltransferase involved in cell wall biosynthesis
MVVHLTASSAGNASRIFKEAVTLNKLLNTDTVVLALLEPNLSQCETVMPGVVVRRYPKELGFLPRSKVCSFIKIIAYFVNSAKRIVMHPTELIIAHSILTLPGCILAGKRLKVPVVYDCHELERGTIGASSGIWKFFTAWLEKTFLPKASAVIVVNDSIADWYENEYGFRPYVLKAYPDARWQSVDSDKTKFRSKFGIPENDIIFLYQGGLMKGRRVEQLIEVFEQAASDRHLVFMGYGELEPLVRESASRCSRIHFHEAVPPDQVLSYTTSADVGISGMEYVSLSNYYSLPNKIMEYIHAGIAVLSPDFPEMRKVVLENKCGWVHEESTDSIRTQVNNLTKAEIAEKAANSVVARSSLTWESQEHVLIEVIEKILKTSVR